MHTLLAQTTPTDPPVPQLPSPPFLAYYVLEHPWPAAVALGAAGLLCAWVLNQRGRAKLGIIVGIALVLLGATVALVGSLVTTQREVLRARTAELIDAGARADTAALSPLLSPDVSFRIFTTTNRYSRDQLFDLVRRYPGDRYPIDSHREDRESATLDSPFAGRTQVHVVTHSTAATLYNVPVGSWWRIEWRREADNDEWRAAAIECLQVDSLAPGTSP